MSNKEGGGNRLFQIVMVLVTSIVAPLLVFFITNTFKSSGQTPTATSSTAKSAAAPALSGEQATIIAPAQATAVAGQPANPPAQAVGVENPSGLVPAGTPAIVDNLVLNLDPGDLLESDQAIRITLRIKNMGADARSVTLTPGAISFRDDRKVYNPLFGDKKSGCSKDELSLNKTISLNPGEEIALVSSESGQPATWCAADQSTRIPAFAGPVSKGINRLLVQINGVGPFKGFAFEVRVNP